MRLGDVYRIDQGNELENHWHCIHIQNPQEILYIIHPQNLLETSKINDLIIASIYSPYQFHFTRLSLSSRIAQHLDTPNESIIINLEDVFNDFQKDLKSGRLRLPRIKYQYRISCIGNYFGHSEIEMMKLCN